MKKTKKAFTLIEVIVSILIVSIVIIAWFQLYLQASSSKIKIVEQTNLEKNVFYFSEKLFSLIKKWWVLDYEEYFNRKIVWLETEDGHYKKNTWFWNFWSGWKIWTEAIWINYWKEFYFCLSWNWEDNKMWRDWCVKKQNISTYSLKDTNKTENVDYEWQPQRYWEYSFQFLDYNSNYDDDKWDENWDWSIKRDDDDEYLWIWPEAFEADTDLKEIYLLSWDKLKRTFIRWNIKQDEFADKISSFEKCDKNPTSPNFKYCRGTIEFLELEGKDWWLDHDDSTQDQYQNDWVVDTWVIAKSFSWKSNLTANDSIIAWWKDDKWYRKALFSDDINITWFKVFAYPNIDNSKVWKVDEQEQQNKYLISPYLITSVKVKPSWKIKTRLRWDVQEIRFNSTINLTEIFSN